MRIKLTKDLEDELRNAKVPEQIIQSIDGYSVEELSVDQLDSVSGGSLTCTGRKGVVILNGVEMTEYEFNEFFVAITKASGFDVGKEMLHAMTGFWCVEMYNNYGWPDCTNVDKMLIVLNHFWMVMDGETWG